MICFLLISSNPSKSDRKNNTDPLINSQTAVNTHRLCGTTHFHIGHDRACQKAIKLTNDPNRVLNLALRPSRRSVLRGSTWVWHHWAHKSTQQPLGVCWKQKQTLVNLQWSWTDVMNSDWPVSNPEHSLYWPVLGRLLWKCNRLQMTSYPI